MDGFFPMGKVCKLIMMLVMGAFLLPPPAGAEPLAKNLFGNKKLPAAITPKSHGFYSKGCLAGGIAIAADGEHWQAMRLSRNRRWGHPELIALLERLSREAAEDGWPGLMIGDISQPRGGPMLTGHASHQIGLDADIWFTKMPKRRLSAKEREAVSAVSVLKKNSLHVDDRIWTKAHTAVLKRAASYRNVERVLVHPGIKKKLCDTVRGDRRWLRKIRPFWGHHYHFHVRIGCPAGSTGCKRQASTPNSDGCDKSLAWWFTEEPWRPAKGPKKPKRRDVMKLSALPGFPEGGRRAGCPGAAAAADQLNACRPNPSRCPLRHNFTLRPFQKRGAHVKKFKRFSPLPVRSRHWPTRCASP
jgi:penicillin-insensitive murein endopeptidase